MKTSLLSLALIGSAFALSACSTVVTPKGAETPEEFDYALSCKLKTDDPKKCEATIRTFCEAPDKAVVRRTRTVDASNAVVYRYQVACND
ncbi:MAG: hypothetical protein RR100_16880 [Comamonas sp.]